jgi:hypothetical protein
MYNCLIGWRYTKKHLFLHFTFIFYLFETIDGFIYLLYKDDHMKHLQDFDKIERTYDFNRHINE